MARVARRPDLTRWSSLTQWPSLTRSQGPRDRVAVGDDAFGTERDGLPDQAEGERSGCGCGHARGQHQPRDRVGNRLPEPFQRDHHAHRPRSRDARDVGEIRHWRPVGYEEHFARSGFSAKALAIAAYRDAPRAIREALADAVAELDEAILEALVTRLRRHRRPPMPGSCTTGRRAIRPLVGRVAGIIHGVAFDESARPALPRSPSTPFGVTR